MLTQSYPDLSARADEYNGLTLAYLGDAVYELAVRERLLAGGAVASGKLHALATGLVSAAAQSDALERIAPVLTEQENAVYHRGRNCKTLGAKSRDPVTHSRATGVEALFGYLYLKGETQRIGQLMDLIMEGEKRE
ncbi:Mini-ribonuclease 3 [Feifania hominis]|uniref:Mini-ribonuclease 3 n=1 Tax=Feifania hominis TaxID=2763660 RepID=A0A926DCX0_9FIRM|nr:ribonuclease III domain-containing protein [Feifania hominis]MBC8536288.1 ribonuclease III [Feifania hominis]